MGRCIGQKADPTARERVDGKCRCMCCNGNLLQHLTTNRRGLSNQQAPAHWEAAPPTKLWTSALLIPTHPLTGPQVTLDPKGAQF